MRIIALLLLIGCSTEEQKSEPPTAEEKRQTGLENCRKKCGSSEQGLSEERPFDPRPTPADPAAHKAKWKECLVECKLRYE